ncbi:MAG: hypothetical protein V3S88_04435 [Alphaproteobacteria bacterium]
MITAREATFALYGAYRLARVDPGGLGYFDATIEGFWRSFYAALLVAPAYVIVLALDLGARPAAAGPARLVLVEGIAYVISWTAFPLAMVYFAQKLDRGRHYIRYIVAHNWAAVLAMAVLLPATAVAASAAAAEALRLLAIIAIFVYQWYIVRTALEITGGQAAAVVVLSLILDIFVAVIASGMLRGPAA